jgi:hypothetical protein
MIPITARGSEISPGYVGIISSGQRLDKADHPAFHGEVVILTEGDRYPLVRH